MKTRERTEEEEEEEERRKEKDKQEQERIEEEVTEKPTHWCHRIYLILRDLHILRPTPLRTCSGIFFPTKR